MSSDVLNSVTTININEVAIFGVRLFYFFSNFYIFLECSRTKYNFSYIPFLFFLTTYFNFLLYFCFFKAAHMYGMQSNYFWSHSIDDDKDIWTKKKFLGGLVNDTRHKYSNLV